MPYIPGIGEVLAGAILGEIGDISRFPSKKKLVAYAGLDASVGINILKNRVNFISTIQLKIALSLLVLII